jgi:small subunit ribosomal protein S7
MSRRNISKKKFPTADSVYGSVIISLLIARILKKGKKTVAQTIIKNVFEIIENKTGLDPLKTIEKAIKNVRINYHCYCLREAIKCKPQRAGVL